MIEKPSASGVVELFKNTTGQRRHFSVRLRAQHLTTPAGVTILVNGAEAPVAGGFSVLVTGAVPVREKDAHLLLQDGDVVAALVFGAATLTVGVSVDPDEYA